MPASKLVRMTRMLGRYQVPGCCPGTRAGYGPGPDCAGGGPMETRRAKRIEARQVADEIAGELRPQPDLEHLASLGPLYDLSDCRHGCNGSPCGSERCTFICHPAPSG